MTERAMRKPPPEEHLLTVKDILDNFSNYLDSMDLSHTPRKKSNFLKDMDRTHTPGKSTVTEEKLEPYLRMGAYPCAPTGSVIKVGSDCSGVESVVTALGQMGLGNRVWVEFFSTTRWLGYARSSSRPNPISWRHLMVPLYIPWAPSQL